MCRRKTYRRWLKLHTPHSGSLRGWRDHALSAASGVTSLLRHVDCHMLHRDIGRAPPFLLHQFVERAPEDQLRFDCGGPGGAIWRGKRVD